MALLEGKVPGGRQRGLLADDLSAEDDDEGGDLGTGGLNTQTRNVSQSLPRFGSSSTQVKQEQQKTHTLPDDLDISFTLDGKKKTRTPSFKIANFMQRMVRQMSIHSPKTRKKRSVSMTREAERSRGLNHVDLNLSPVPSSPGGKVVTPIVWEKGQIPGVMGIRNHGNTCFMNAVIQCLSHTDLLVEYFVTDHYKHDIKRNNKQNARKYGTKGELTENLATLLKSIWTCQYSSSLSSDFKSVVGKYGTQYKGYAQHDAQEFLMWLLDKVHEDLNVASKKKIKTSKNHSRLHPDDSTGDMLTNHLRCNNSFVYDLFQAVYRSTLTCPHCRRQSNTFDPFLSISLPIPQKTKRPLYVTVVYYSALPKQVKIGLLMEQYQTVRDLRQTLASDTRIPESQLLLTEVYDDGFHRTFNDSQSLSDIAETDHIYAIEVQEDESENEEEEPSIELATLLVLNMKGSTHDGKRFGSPIILHIHREASYTEIQNTLLQCMVSTFKEPIATQRLGVLFRLRVLDGLPGRCYLPHDVEHPLYMPTVDRALQCCTPGSGPEHIKLIAEWDQQAKLSLLSTYEDHVEEHTSVRQVQLAHDQPVLGTLDECFQLYTQDERLNGDDAWHCPNCRRRQQGTIKSINLWSLPDILVIHLKRFKQDGLKRNKLNTLITFPVTGLDMSHHATPRNNMNSNHSNKPVSSLSPWRRYKQSINNPDDHVFDLYAVCNHYGNMQGGHYTAFCKNTADRKWYTFDDTKVTEMPEEEVVTRAAYLLFYQRRSSNQTDVADINHWIHALPRVHLKGSKFKQSKSHEDLLEETTPRSPTQNSIKDNNEFSRNLQAYATLRIQVPKVSRPSESAVTQTSPQKHHTTPTNTRGLTVGQMSRQREQQKQSTSRSDLSPQLSGSSPNPGTPSSIRSSNSDYDNLAPQFENSVNMSPCWARSQTLPRQGLVRQSSSPLEVSNRVVHGPNPPIKSPSYDFNFGTKISSPVRVIPRSIPRDVRSDTLMSDSSHNTTVSAPAGPDRREQETKSERSNIGLTRSLTSPEVAAPPVMGETISRRGKDGQDKKMQKWEYGKTVFMQESCV